MEENSKIAHSTYMALKENFCDIFYHLSEVKRIGADMIEHRSRNLSEKEKEQINSLISYAMDQIIVYYDK